MATYSLSITAQGAHNPFAPKTVKIDDTYCASPGAESQAMMDGQVFTAQGPDGGSFLAVFDTERSIPGVLRIVRRYR